MNTDKHNDFYIGWQEKAPTAYASVSKRFIFLLLVIVFLVAGCIVIGQKGFGDAVFEFGSLTTVEGILVKNPVPMLKVPIAESQTNETDYESIILVGFGKTGAEKVINAFEAEEGIDPEGKWVILSGTRIYHDGKSAFELTEGTSAFIGWEEEPPYTATIPKGFGTVSLFGEILDPKCALGVMKPAEGKPHRSCAVRCISGGIPPVLRMRDRTGNTNYALVLGKDGSTVNKKILPYIADQVRICGRLEQQDDWLIVYTDPEKDIFRIRPFGRNENIPVCGL